MRRDPRVLAERLRLEQNAVLNPTERRLLDAWARAYAVIRDDLLAAVEAEGDGISAASFRRGRLGRAMNEASTLLALLNARSSRWAIDAVPQVVEASEAQARVFLQMSAKGRFDYNRPDPAVLDATVRRTTQTIASRYIVLSASAEESLRVNLVRAVAAADGARPAARRMLVQTRGVFGGGAARALNLARTELVDAYRAGSAATREANGDVVTGWRWSSALDSRTCPACWAQHNSVHAADEPLLGHQSCRCVPVPITKWDGPGDDVGDPEQAFRRLPPAEQRKVMGPQRLAALDAGVPFTALAVQRDNPGWRPGMYATPVRDLRVS